MQVKYTPLLDDEPDTIEAFGTTLEKGKWVDVPDSFAGKAQANPYVETRDEPSDDEGEPTAKKRGRRSNADLAAEQRALAQDQALKDARAQEAFDTGGETSA